MYCIGEKAELKEDVLDVQSRSMRDNLLFHGVPECDFFDQRKEEKCDEKIIILCDQTLHIENAGNIKIERAHRMGRYTAGRTRPIVVKFNHYPDKVRVKQSAYTAKRDTNYRVSEQFPKEIQERRRILYPEMRKAQAEKRRVVMSYDKLYVDGRTITADSIRARDEKLIIRVYYGSS